MTNGVLPETLPSPGGLGEKARRENFAVASLLLPAPVRRDLTAIYGFARFVDDLGDEAPGDRMALLDAADVELDRAFGGTATHAVFQELEPSIRRHRLPEAPFRRLIEANRQDQRVCRYPMYQDLLDYCALSANPVGHLVLAVLGRATPDRLALSDRVCTGLQLVEHWQDVAEDLARGRIYLPHEDLERFGVREADLAARSPNAPVRRLLAFECDRARDLLSAGVPLAATLPGRIGFAIAGYAGGGVAALDAIRRAGYDVLGRQPRPTRRERAAAVVRAFGRSVALRSRRARGRSGSAAAAAGASAGIGAGDGR